MRIYLSHSSSFDYSAQLYEPIKSSQLYTAHSVFLPHDSQTVVKTRDIITHSDLVFAKVSYPSTGQGIELGWADAAGVLIVCFFREGMPYSSSLQFISDQPTSYANIDELLSKMLQQADGFKLNKYWLSERLS